MLNSTLCVLQHVLPLLSIFKIRIHNNFLFLFTNSESFLLRCWCFEVDFSIPVTLLVRLPQRHGYNTNNLLNYPWCFLYSFVCMPIIARMRENATSWKYLINEAKNDQHILLCFEIIIIKYGDKKYYVLYWWCKTFILEDNIHDYTRESGIL